MREPSITPPPTRQNAQATVLGTGRLSHQTTTDYQQGEGRDADPPRRASVIVRRNVIGPSEGVCCSAVLSGRCRNTPPPTRQDTQAIVLGAGRLSNQTITDDQRGRGWACQARNCPYPQH